MKETREKKPACILAVKQHAREYFALGAEQNNGQK
jgi:hypothetical protein